MFSGISGRDSERNFGLTFKGNIIGRFYKGIQGSVSVEILRGISTWVLERICQRIVGSFFFRNC